MAQFFSDASHVRARQYVILERGKVRVLKKRSSQGEA